MSILVAPVPISFIGRFIRVPLDALLWNCILFSSCNMDDRQIKRLELMWAKSTPTFFEPFSKFPLYSCWVSSVLSKIKTIGWGFEVAIIQQGCPEETLLIRPRSKKWYWSLHIILQAKLSRKRPLEYFQGQGDNLYLSRTWPKPRALILFLRWPIDLQPQNRVLDQSKSS